MVESLIVFIVLCVIISVSVQAFIYDAVCYSRKKKHQREWNAMKRKMETEHKSEGDIRCAYFEYCKKLIAQHNDCFGWGIPEIGYINVRRYSDDTEAVAE